MNKDNIQELLKPRYKVIADYPYCPYEIGELVEFSTSGTSFLCTRTKEYDDFREDIVDNNNYFAIKALDKYPHLFRRLEWWEDRDVKDMPEYLKSNINDKNWYGNVVFEKVDMFYGDNNEYVALVDRDEMMQYCTSWYLPATETEYLNQTNQP